jgi:hypothetical protein
MARPARVPPTKAKPKSEKQSGRFVEHLDLNKLYPRERTLTDGEHTVVLPGKLKTRDLIRIRQFELAMDELDAKGHETTEEDAAALEDEITAFVMELVRRRTPDAPDLELNFLDHTAIFYFLTGGQKVADAVLGLISDQRERNDEQATKAAQGDGAQAESAKDDEPPLASSKPSRSRPTSSRSSTAGSRKRGSSSASGRSASTRSKRSSS